MPAPVRPTCPDIDKVIRKIESALKAARKGKKDLGTENEGYDYLNDIEDDLWGLESEMEKLRSANAALREWGEEMESVADDLQAQVTKLEDRNEYAQ